MDKLKRYDIELGDDGFWNNCLVVDESYNGDWVRYSEVRDEIEKLESEKAELLKALEEANKSTMLYDGHPGRYASVIAKVKGQQ
jgi:hypothetical protein